MQTTRRKLQEKLDMESAVVVLASVIGDSKKAEEVQGKYTAEEIREIAKWFAQGYDMESSIKIGAPGKSFL